MTTEKKKKLGAVRPTKFPRWATVPSLDPVVGGSNVVEPPEQLKDDGWARKQKPPANHQNWLHNLTYLWLEYLDVASIALPKNYLSGFHTSRDAGDPAHDLLIKIGECRDADDTIDIRLTSDIIKQTDADWAEGSGAGGFPSGLTIAANTWYRVFSITKEDGTVDAGVDSAADASNLLADATDYVSARRVSWMKTDGASEIKHYIQLEDNPDYFYWDAPIEDVSDTDPGTSALLKTLTVPPDQNVIALIIAQLIASISTNFEVFMHITPPFVSAGGFASLISYYFTTLSSEIMGAGEFEVATNTNSQIQYKLGASRADTTVQIFTRGWIDNRGKK